MMEIPSSHEQDFESCYDFRLCYNISEQIAYLPDRIYDILKTQQFSITSASFDFIVSKIEKESYRKRTSLMLRFTIHCSRSTIIKIKLVS